MVNGKLEQFVIINHLTPRSWIASTKEYNNIMKNNKLIFIAGLLCLAGFSWPFSWLFSHPNPEPLGTQVWMSKEEQLLESESNISPDVLKLALTAYVHARREGLDSKQLLTVIDFTKPSTDKRLWIFNLKTNQEVMNTWVTHGRNSGELYATSFSNQPGSLKSSIGVFLTAEPFNGEHGIALPMHGLEPGINNNAYGRAIEFHGAQYVNYQTIKNYGQIGRSWGCTAVSQSEITPLVDTIKDNTLVFAYYPDHYWLHHSAFLDG